MGVFPEYAPVYDALYERYEDFFPAEVIEATQDVYVARGFNRDNPVLIVGPDGLIVIDPGESIEAAQIVKDAFNAYPKLKGIFRKKTVKAIIYTHHHDCHIHGASVFADTYTEIIAHENLMTTLYYDWYNQLYPSRLIGDAKMMDSLFTTEDPVYDTVRHR